MTDTANQVKRILIQRVGEEGAPYDPVDLKPNTLVADVLSLPKWRGYQLSDPRGGP